MLLSTIKCSRCGNWHSDRHPCRVLPRFPLLSRVDYAPIAMAIRREGYSLHSISLRLEKDREWLGRLLNGKLKSVEYQDAMNLFELACRILPEKVSARVLPLAFRQSKEENNHQPGETLHWYAISFSTGAATASVCIGFPSMAITVDRIREAKSEAGVPSDAVILACCYLGQMTYGEMMGKESPGTRPGMNCGPTPRQPAQASP